MAIKKINYNNMNFNNIKILELIKTVNQLLDELASKDIITLETTTNLEDDATSDIITVEEVTQKESEL